MYGNDRQRRLPGRQTMPTGVQHEQQHAVEARQQSARSAAGSPASAASTSVDPSQGGRHRQVAQ